MILCEQTAPEGAIWWSATEKTHPASSKFLLVELFRIQLHSVGSSTLYIQLNIKTQWEKGLTEGYKKKSFGDLEDVLSLAVILVYETVIGGS